MELRFVTAKSPDFAMLTQRLDAYYFELVGDVHKLCRYEPSGKLCVSGSGI